MSEVVSEGTAVVAASACAALAGQALAAGYAAYKGLRWLSEQAKNEMERLEKELAKPVSYTTTADAREQFKKQYAVFKEEAAKSAILKTSANAAARILTLKTSPLGLFLEKDEWKKVLQPETTKQLLSEMLGRASGRLTQANAAYVSRSVTEAAREAGFTTERSQRLVNGKKVTVMEDELGRALVTEVTSTDKGAGIQLDLTGFADGSCHGVMDRVLNGMTKRGVRIDGLRRRSHYRREGVLMASGDLSDKRLSPTRQIRPDQEREAESRHRWQLHYGQRVKIKT
jgi:hypothetical protein